MVELTESEVDARACNLCPEPADFVVPRHDGEGTLSLCEECLRDLFDSVMASKSSH